MSEAAHLFDDTSEKLLSRLLPDVAVQRDAAPVRAALFQALLDSGLPMALASNESGGMGADLADACIIAWRWGYHAAPLPVVPILLGHGAAGMAGAELANSVVLAESRNFSPGAAGPGVDVPAVPGQATTVALVTQHSGAERLVALDVSGAGGFRDLAGEPWLRLAAREAHVLADWPLPPGASDLLRMQGALLTAAQMTGAMARLLEMIIEHANIRQQFGRPLAKFQAIQSLIADAACEQVATQAAVAAAVDAFDRGTPQPLLTLSAKAQAGQAATRVTAVAHQVLGAIGFTEDHALGRYSKRLWDWRDLWGRQSACEEEIGSAAATDGRGLWRHMTD